MEVIGIVATIVGTLVALVGVIWAIVFGQRNLMDFMKARRSPQVPDTSSKALSKRSPRTRKDMPGQNQLLPPKSRFDSWLLITGRLMLICWFSYDPYDNRTTLPSTVGSALRFFLIVAPVLMIAGFIFTGIGIVVENGSGALHFGLVLLVGFLASFIGAFFILGMVGLIGLFLTIMPNEVFDVFNDTEGS